MRDMQAARELALTVLKGGVQEVRDSRASATLRRIAEWAAGEDGQYFCALAGIEHEAYLDAIARAAREGLRNPD